MMEYLALEGTVGPSPILVIPCHDRELTAVIEETHFCGYCQRCSE